MIPFAPELSAMLSIEDHFPFRTLTSIFLIVLIKTFKVVI